ncbi:uncharacterized protein LOC117296976 [Asterias rubens]|uniref:uncharacterized protein LOC117296976 n=1 Tax=Asterias rubens TaxID=7604 RepID=UPI0014557A16|nr:uncharacterized protein LOC117296976 [Asterias rubens]
MGSSYRFLSIALGLLFCASGVVKVVPLEPAYSMQKSEFNRFVQVFPFQSFTGYKPTADLFRTVVGVLELSFGLLLACGTYEWHCYSSYALLGIMVGAVYTLLALSDPVQNVLIPAVFGGLLFYLITRQGRYNS